MDRRPLILIGTLAATVAAVVAVRKFVEDPAVRERLGLGGPKALPHYGDDVDVNSEDSFPASDPPSFTTSRA